MHPILMYADSEYDITNCYIYILRPFVENTYPQILNNYIVIQTTVFSAMCPQLHSASKSKTLVLNIS